ncbi:MAG: hypothetical protein NVS4B8_11390 [Herpetosiphon sp.]
MAPYRAISFDAGYTLLSPVEEAHLVVERMLAQRGIVPTPQAIAAAYDRAEALYHHQYHQPLNETWASDASIHGFFQKYYVQFLADLGVDDAEGAQARAIIAHYNQSQNWRLYPGVIETLQELRARGFRIGIASDWGSDLRHILLGHGITPLLDWAVISGSVGCAKPSPTFYNEVVRRAGVPPSEIVHVGDSYRGDILGARTVGIDGILIDWTGRPMPRLDVAVIPNIQTLLPLLDRPGNAISDG